MKVLNMEAFVLRLAPDWCRNDIKDLDKNWRGKPIGMDMYPAHAFTEINTFIYYAPVELCLTSSSKYIRECKRWFLEQEKVSKGT